MATVLITGASGLIGHEVRRLLIAEGNHTVYGIGREINEDCNIALDLSSDWDKKVLPPRVDIIVHLAQSELFRDFPASASKIFNVNTSSTLKLLEYAREAGVQKFVFASSGGIYSGSGGEHNEEDPIMARSDLGFYLSTKLCSELLVQNYSRFFSLDILRFFFVYGPRQKANMLIPRLINSIRQGSEITLQGENGVSINPVSVNDAARAVIATFALKGFNRINVAGQEVLTLRDICNIIAERLQKQAVFRIENGEQNHLLADITKMKKLLVSPQVTFSEGLNMMLAYEK